MNYYRLKFSTLAITSAMAALMLASCSADEVEQVNNGPEIRFTTKVSRATVTDVSTLKEFYVYAQAEGFTDFLLNNDVATQAEKNSSIYQLDRKFYWENSIKRAEFWAFGAPDLSDAQKASFQFNTNSHSLPNIVIPAEHKRAGIQQKDLVAAHTVAERPSGGAVALTFKHAFSQIEIKAHTGSNSIQKVYVRGVWLMNIQSKANMSFGEDNKIVWNAHSNDLVEYGRVFEFNTTPSEQGKMRAHLLPNGETSADQNLITNPSDNSVSQKYSLMLLPQTNNEYKFADRAASDGNGTYILFLCRIISEHKGTPEPEYTDKVMQDESDPTKHWHQLFPAPDPDRGYTYGEYGYACVPVAIDWEAGKKYIYNIEFCGQTSGGGQYPPELPEGTTFPGADDPDITIVPRPDDKNPGDPVLDKELTFTITIEDWVDETVPTPMH